MLTQGMVLSALPLTASLSGPHSFSMACLKSSCQVVGSPQLRCWGGGVASAFHILSQVPGDSVGILLTSLEPSELTLGDVLPRTDPQALKLTPHVRPSEVTWKALRIFSQYPGLVVSKKDPLAPEGPLVHFGI